MKHIIGLMRPDSGSITIDDEDVTKFDDRRLLGVRRKFGMVFQQAALFDSMSVWDNVAFPLKEHTDLPHEEINRRVLDKLTWSLWRTPSISSLPSYLAVRKRVGLARALILDPQCVLYDEPTRAGSAAENVDQMILDAAERLKMTSVVISHDIGSAIKVAET